MPIGKDSITKRVAKVEKTEENIAPELVATTAAAPKKTPAKKTTTTTTTKKAPAKKPAPKAEPKVETTVISNIAPETVETVIGRKETDETKKVQIGQDLPIYLM